MPTTILSKQVLKITSYSKGKWKLPIYRSPTTLDLDTRDIYKLRPLLKLLLSVRIALPRDEIYN